METPIQFEERTWACPRCWKSRGVFMGLTASRDCLCGYQFPEWAVRKAEATREAAASIENGEFGTVEFARDADPMSIVLETSTGNFYFKHWKIEI